MKTVYFEFDGDFYMMTEAQVKAGYWYQRHSYLLEDAQRILSELYSESTYLKDLLAELNITYVKALSKDMLEKYVQQYEKHQSNDVDECLQWRIAIERVLVNEFSKECNFSRR